MVNYGNSFLYNLNQTKCNSFLQNQNQTKCNSFQKDTKREIIFCFMLQIFLYMFANVMFYL